MKCVILAAVLAFPVFGAEGFFCSSTDGLPVAVTRAKATAPFQVAMPGKAFVAKTKFGEAPAAGGQYRFFVVEASVQRRLKFRVDFPLAPEDFAGVAEGFADVDAAGWPCKLVTLRNKQYRVYRLLNELNGSFNFEATHNPQ